jgi:hypothetical protein
MRVTSEPHLFPHRLYHIALQFDVVDGLGIFIAIEIYYCHRAQDGFANY